MRNKINVLGALALTATLGACSLQRPAANEWGCTLGSGPMDERGLKGRYGPGASGDWTNDDFVTGPADVRFYIVDEDPATADFGGRPIVVPARGTSDEGVGVVQVSVETQVRFVFNERFCDWYIDHGKRSEPLNFDGDPEKGDGWRVFLNTSMNQKLIEAARPVVATEDYISLYVNAPIGEDGELAYEALAQALSTNLSRELTKDLGGEYFCGPSYEFDGNADGELEKGCPPLEVTIKRVAPVDTSLIERLELIVSNEEQQRAIASEEARRNTEIASEERIAVREQQRRAEVEVAEAEANREVQVARAVANLEVAQAEEEVLRQEQQNADISAVSSTAFCRELAAVGVDCALLEAAKQGAYPRIILSGDSDASILVSGD